MDTHVIDKPDPLAKARAVKAEKRAQAQREQSEIESAEPSPWDIIAELRQEIAAMKGSRVAVVAAPVINMERAIVQGQKLSPANRAKLEEMAEIIPTNPDEYRIQANAAARLKQANPGVWVTIVATRRGVYLRSRQVAPTKYEEYADFTRPDSLAISGDDLAKIAPGGIGQKFRIGEKALVTQDAAERLMAMGFVELA